MLDSISLNLLKKSSLSEKEALVYLAALQLGSSSVSDIAKFSGLQRPNTYVVIDGLLEKNYLSHIPSSKIKRYAATDPNILSSELEQTSTDFKDMLPYLQNVHQKAGKPHVTYYNGVEGTKKAFAQIQKPKEVFYALSIEKVEEFIPDEVARWKNLYLKNKARKGGKHLLCDTKTDRSYGNAVRKSGQVVRYLRRGQKLDMDLVLFDGKVMLTAFDDKIHVTMIESDSLYSSLKALYNLAWQGAKRK